MRGGGHRPAPGRHPVGQVRPRSCHGGPAGLLQLVLERVGGKGRHGGRVSRVPGADVASVPGSAWPATPQACRGPVLPAGVPSPAARAPRQEVAPRTPPQPPNRALSSSEPPPQLFQPVGKRPQRQIVGTTWQTPR